jgi:hypothetical protein
MFVSSVIDVGNLNLSSYLKVFHNLDLVSDYVKFRLD